MSSFIFLFFFTLTGFSDRFFVNLYEYSASNIHMLSTSADSDRKQNYCIWQDLSSWTQMQTMIEIWM